MMPPRNMAARAFVLIAIMLLSEDFFLDLTLQNGLYFDYPLFQFIKSNLVRVPHVNPIRRWVSNMSMVKLWIISYF